MKWKHVVMLLVVFFLVQVFFACEEKGLNTSSVTDDIVVKQNVIAMDNINNLSLIHFTDSSLVFSYSGKMPDIKIGDILTSRANDYTKKVDSLDVGLGVISIMTSQAAITDVIEKIRIDTTITLSLSDILQKPTMEGVYLAPGVTLTGDYIDLTNYNLFSGSAHGVDLKAKITEGFLSYDLDDEIVLEIDLGGIQKFSTIVEGDLDFDCKFLIECSQDFNYTSQEIELVSFNKQVVVATVGVVPIWVDATFTITMGFSAYASGYQKASGGYHGSFGLEFGAVYEHGGWSDVWEHHADFDDYPFNWYNREEIWLEIHLTPTVELKIESLVGPYAYAQPYLEFEAEFGDPKSWSWELYAGAEGRIAFEIAFLVWQLANYDVYLDNWEVLVASAHGEDETPDSDLPTADAGGPYYATVGEQINFTGNGSDSDGYITQYCWELLNYNLCERNPKDTPNSEGTFTVRLRVQDNDDNWSDWDEAKVYVNTDEDDDPDDPDTADKQPIADAGGPYSAMLDELIQLSSAGSYDPDGDEVTRWYWEFADGATSNEENPLHSWGEDGIYFPRLRVYANGQWSEWDGCQVTVEDDEPQTAMIELAVNLEEAPCYINGQLVSYGDYHGAYEIGKRYVINWEEIENYHTPPGDDILLTASGFSKYYEYEIIDDGLGFVLIFFETRNDSNDVSDAFYPREEIHLKTRVLNTSSTTPRSFSHSVAVTGPDGEEVYFSYDENFEIEPGEAITFSEFLHGSYEKPLASGPYSVLLTGDLESETYFDVIDSGVILDEFVIMDANHVPQDTFLTTQTVLAKVVVKNTSFSETYLFNCNMTVVNQFGQEVHNVNESWSVPPDEGRTGGFLAINWGGTPWPAGNYTAIFSGGNINEHREFTLIENDTDNSTDVQATNITLQLPSRGYFNSGEVITCITDLKNDGSSGYWNIIFTARSPGGVIAWSGWSVSDLYAEDNPWTYTDTTVFKRLATIAGTWSLNMKIISNSVTKEQMLPQGIITQDTTMYFEVSSETDLAVDEIYFLDRDRNRVTWTTPGTFIEGRAVIRNTSDSMCAIFPHWTVKSFSSQIMFDHSWPAHAYTLESHQVIEVFFFLKDETLNWPNGVYTVQFVSELFETTGTFEIR